MNHASGEPSLWRWRRFRAWLGVAVIVAVVLLQLPLFGVLGFELALAMAVLVSIAGLDLGAAAMRARPGDAAGEVARAARLAVRATLLLTGPALLMALVHGVWVPTCDWTFGLRAYALMPGAGAVVFAGAGVVLGGWRPRRYPRVAAIIAPPLGWLTLAGLGLARFYGEPPVFTYSPILGYFPGNLYDEHVELGAPLYWARLEQALVVATALLALAAWRARRPVGVRAGEIRLRVANVLVATALLVGASAGALRCRAGDLGYAVDSEDIQAALGGRLETEHFVIYYEPTFAVLADLELVAADHEFRLAQVVATLGVAPDRKLRSYYFASATSKARWLGARRVEMAKPWRGEIYLEHREFPHASLRHEIAHVVAAQFGDPVFGVAAGRLLGAPVWFNPGLIEGLAVAVDWPGNLDKDLTPHQAVRAMVQQGVRPKLTQLFSLGFLAESSVRGYATAGSFVRWLLETFGPDKLRALYRSGGEFEATYGQPLAALGDAWLAMIATVELPPEAGEATRERFRQASVFARPCPHAVAAKRARVDQLLARRRVAEAIQLQRSVCSDAPEEPTFRYELAQVLALGDLAQRAEALALMQGLSTDPAATSSLRADALAALAAHAVRSGDLAGGHALTAAALALPLDDDDRRAQSIKALALEHQGPAGPALRDYFFPLPDSDGALAAAARAVALEPALAIGHYLLGLQLAAYDQYARAAEQLATALALGLEPSATRRAARVLARVAFRADRPGDLARALSALDGPDATAMDRAVAADWRARLAARTPGPTSR